MVQIVEFASYMGPVTASEACRRDAWAAVCCLTSETIGRFKAHRTREARRLAQGAVLAHERAMENWR